MRTRMKQGLSVTWSVGTKPLPWHWSLPVVAVRSGAGATACNRRGRMPNEPTAPPRDPAAGRASQSGETNPPRETPERERLPGVAISSGRLHGVLRTQNEAANARGGSVRSNGRAPPERVRQETQNPSERSHCSGSVHPAMGERTQSPPTIAHAPARPARRSPSAPPAGLHSGVVCHRDRHGGR